MTLDRHAMKSAGGSPKFNRWFSQLSDHRRRNIDPGDDDDYDDPWGDRTQPLEDLADVKMTFDDDFHLTVIPNFLHDSDAYVANLENKLERLRRVNRTVNPKEMVAVMVHARALRQKNAELQVGLLHAPESSSEECDDGGIFAFWPAIILPLSRRLFPRLALTKEERQHLLKYDFLHQNYEDDNSSAASVVADRSVTRQVERDSPPDTSWERQHRDSAEELPPIVFESLEANELQIPKAWLEDQDTQQATCTLLEDIARTNRSALSLSTTTASAPQDVSTLTSLTRSRKSEDAFYHFAYIKSSATSTADSAKTETPVEYRITLARAGYLSSTGLPSKEGVPFTSLYCASVAHVQQPPPALGPVVPTRRMPSKPTTETTDLNNREPVVGTTQSSPTLGTSKNGQNGNQGNTEQCALGQLLKGERGPTACVRHSVYVENSPEERQSPEQNKECSRLVRDMIMPEITIASSSTRETIAATEPVPAQRRVPLASSSGCQLPMQDITLQEVTVASSSTRESLVPTPWLQGKSSDISQQCSADDVHQHMSSLVRASIDEDDEPQDIQHGTLVTYLQSTSTLGRFSRASERTIGSATKESERFSHYSDPQSNANEEMSCGFPRREDGQVPMIRMFGSCPQNIQSALQDSFRSWVQHKSADSSSNVREANSSATSLRTVASEQQPLGISEGNLPSTNSCGICDSTNLTCKWHIGRQHYKVYGEAIYPTFTGQEPIISKASSVYSGTHSLGELPRSVFSNVTNEPESLTSVKTTDTATVLPMDEKRVALHPSGAKLATSTTFKNRQRSVHWFETYGEDMDMPFSQRDAETPPTVEQSEELDEPPNPRPDFKHEMAVDVEEKAIDRTEVTAEEALGKLLATNKTAPEPPQDPASDRNTPKSEESLVTRQNRDFVFTSLAVQADKRESPPVTAGTSEEKKEDSQAADSGEKKQPDKPSNTDTTVLHCHEVVWYSQSSARGSRKISMSVRKSMSRLQTLRLDTSTQFRASGLRRSITSILSNDSIMSKPFPFFAGDPPRFPRGEATRLQPASIVENGEESEGRFTNLKSASCSDLDERMEVDVAMLGPLLPRSSSAAPAIPKDFGKNAAQHTQPTAASAAEQKNDIPTAPDAPTKEKRVLSTIDRCPLLVRLAAKEEACIVATDISEPPSLKTSQANSENTATTEPVAIPPQACNSRDAQPAQSQTTTKAPITTSLLAGKSATSTSKGAPKFEAKEVCNMEAVTPEQDPPPKVEDNNNHEASVGTVATTAGLPSRPTAETEQNDSTKNAKIIQLLEANDRVKKSQLSIMLRPGPLSSKSDLEEGKTGPSRRCPSHFSLYEMLSEQSESDSSFGPPPQRESKANQAHYRQTLEDVGRNL